MKSETIFTVDDFGISANANKLILQAFENGIITHASTMINMAGSDQALASVKKYKSIKFGLHLNLTEPIDSRIRYQIEKMQSSVGTIDFINSHHNIHFLPVVLPIVIKLAKQYKISKIRLPKKLVGGGVKPVLMKLSSLFNLSSDDLRLSDNWLDLDWYREEKILKLAKSLPKNIEISCHPLVFQKHRQKSTLQWLIENKNQLI